MRVFSLLEASVGSRVIHPAPTAGTMHEHKFDARVETNDGRQAAGCSNRDTNLLEEQWACDRKGEGSVESGDGEASGSLRDRPDTNHLSKTSVLPLTL
jgi:hypothetical protein